MKALTLQECKKQIRRKFDMVDAWNVGGDTSDETYLNEVAILFAKQALIVAAEQATLELSGMMLRVDKQSIIDTDLSELL